MSYPIWIQVGPKQDGLMYPKMGLVTSKTTNICGVLSRLIGLVEGKFTGNHMCVVKAMVSTITYPLNQSMDCRHRRQKIADSLESKLSGRMTGLTKKL